MYVCAVCEPTHAPSRAHTLTGESNCIMGDWFGEETIKLIKLWGKIKGRMTKF